MNVTTARRAARHNPRRTTLVAEGSLRSLQKTSPRELDWVLGAPWHLNRTEPQDLQRLAGGGARLP
jgi:hypothetical protein